jgi:hypothetical protein
MAAQCFTKDLVDISANPNGLLECNVYCPQCGTLNQDDVISCQNCGTTLIEDAAQSLLKLSQQRAVLSWALALPIGWFLGWVVGTTVGYRNPALISHINPKIPWDLALAQKIGASDGGLRGGAVGILFALVVATWITTSALRSVTPALKPMQTVLVIFAWTLPWIFFLVTAYFLVGHWIGF